MKLRSIENYLTKKFVIPAVIFSSSLLTTESAFADVDIPAPKAPPGAASHAREIIMEICGYALWILPSLLVAFYIFLGLKYFMNQSDAHEVADIKKKALAGAVVFILTESVAYIINAFLQRMGVQ